MCKHNLFGGTLKTVFVIAFHFPKQVRPATLLFHYARQLNADQSSLRIFLCVYWPYDKDFMVVYSLSSVIQWELIWIGLIRTSNEYFQEHFLSASMEHSVGVEEFLL